MLRSLTFISLLLLMNLSHAEIDSSDNSTSFNAYISQGWIKTSANKVSGSSDAAVGSFDRTEIGAYGYKQLNSNFDIRLNTKIFNDGKRSDNFEPKVIYFLGDLHQELVTSVYGVRIGRVKHLLGFYNGSRDNPAYRDLDILPQAIYRDNFRDMATSGDGFQTYFYERDLPVVDVEIEASRMKPVLFPMQDILAGFFGFGAPSGNFSSSALVYGFNVGINEKKGNWSLRYDLTDMDYDYETGKNDIFPSGKMNTNVHYFGARKYFINSDITAEYIFVKRNGKTWNFLLASDPQSTPFGYNLTYRYSQHCFTYSVSYNAWYYSNHDKDGSKMQAMTGVPASQAYSKDLNFGVKWSHHHWTIKGEFHHINGTNMLSNIENQIYQTKPNWNLLSSSITYEF